MLRVHQRVAGSLVIVFVVNVAACTDHRASPTIAIPTAIAQANVMMTKAATMAASVTLVAVMADLLGAFMAVHPLYDFRAGQDS